MSDEYVKGRMYAREVVRVFGDDQRDKPKDFIAAFWQCLLELANERARDLHWNRVNLTPPPTMDDAEAREFEKETIPFGKYCYRPVGEIMQRDPKYLDWLAGCDFTDALNRYLGSGYVKQKYAGLLASIVDE
jgi:hypothetical protein